MKILFSKAARKKGAVLVFALVFSAFIVFALGIAVGGGYLDVFAAESPNQQQIKCRLMEDAMKRVGACSLDQAVTVWADGLKMRNGAMQYSVMSNSLKPKYAAELNNNFPSWVTGLSSPYVESYKVEKNEDLGDGKHKVTLSVALATSTGPAGSYKAELTLAREDNFWRITSVLTEEALFPYTGFSPSAN